MMTEHPVGGQGRGAQLVAIGPSPLLLGALLAMVLTGLGLTGYLAVSAFGRGTVAGCAAGSACSMAMSSAWAWWLRVPVSGLAAGMYALILVSAMATRMGGVRLRRGAWTLLSAAALMLIGAAIWFVYVLLFRVGVMCPYCTVSHLIGLAVAGLILTVSATLRGGAGGGRLIGPACWVLAVAAALAGLTALIGVQVLWPTSTYALVDASASTTPEHDENDGHDHGGGNKKGPLPQVGSVVHEVDGRLMIAPDFTDVPLDPSELPMMGRPDAKHLLVFFFDYTCGACRQTHRLLRYARQQFGGDQIGVVLVTTPNSPACNPLYAEWGVSGSEDSCRYARLGLALWRISPEVFTQYEGWLLNFKTVPPLDVGVKQALDLAGRDKLEAALADPWVERTLERFVQFGRPVLEHFRGTPILLMGHKFLQGIPDDPEAFCKLLEQELGVTRIAHEEGR